MSTIEDQPVSAVVQARDPDGTTPVTPVIDSPPAKGTMSANGTGPITFTYMPGPGKTGMDTFTYHVTDSHGSSNMATVGITIAAVPPVVAGQSFSGKENGTISGQIVMKGPAGETLTLSVTTPASHGAVQLTDASTGAFTYTPTTDYNGADSFQVRASDAVSTSTVATISLNIAAVDGSATANPVNFVVPAAGTTLLDVLASATDGEDAGLSISVVQQPAGATATISGNKIAFTPNANSTGLTRFTYQLTDSSGAQSRALVRVVIGSMTPLIFLADNDSLGVFELYFTDHFAVYKISAPLAPGEYIQGYESSSNGKWLVYETSTPVPVTQRLWLADLSHPGTPPTPITTPSTVSYLQMSPDGARLLFSGMYVNTSRPAQVYAIPSQGSVDRAIFSHDGGQIFYSVILSGGGRVIDSTPTPAQGPIGYTQLTQTYPVAEGLGIDFVATADDTKLVSSGLFSLFPPPAGPSQEAFVTPTLPPFADRRLNPPLTNSIDSIVQQPIVSVDSRYACYIATIGGLPGVYANDLTQTGNAVAVDSAASNWFLSGLQIAPDARTLFYAKAPSNVASPPFYYADLTQPGSARAFSPVGKSATPPRTLSIAPDQSAVAFDSGTSVYLSAWGHFDAAKLVVALGSNAGNPQFDFSADSNGLAIAGEGASSALYVASPKTGDIYQPLSASATGVRCFSFAGTGCWW